MAPWQPAPLVVLDFDETLVDRDSSEWVAAQLGAASLFDELRWVQGLPWHRAMNAVLRALHSQGISVAHIRKAASSLPLPPQTVSVLSDAHALGCELHIVSDANTFFIEAVLASHGLDRLFTQIHSNPAWVDAKGCLHYDDYHDSTLTPHNCPMCPPNMCKGRILEAIRVAAVPAEDPASLKVIYGGDGMGDLCPSSRLNAGDHVLPRQGFPLAKLIDQHPVKARVHPWMSLAATLHDTVLNCIKMDDHDMRPPYRNVSSSITFHPSDGPCDWDGYVADRPSTGFDSVLKMKHLSQRRAIITCQCFQVPRSVHFGIDQRMYAGTYPRMLQLGKGGKAWNLSQADFCRSYRIPVSCG